MSSPPSPSLVATSSSGKPSLARQLLLPAVSGSLAVCLSHPLELTKARLQVDLELARRGTVAGAAGGARAYEGWADCVAKNWRANGLRGLQAGLLLGVTREFFFNGVRLGCFEPLVDAVQGANGTAGQPPKPHERLAGGLTAGALGGLLINPIDVLKTRAQIAGAEAGYSHAAAGAAGVGGGAAAAAALWREEGPRGLLRGVGVNTLRGLLGPGSQVTSYALLKERVAAAAAARWGGVGGGSGSGSSGGKHWVAEWFGEGAVATHVVCSLASAAVSVACVNPVDVVRTRVFNQPVGPDGVGLRYSGGVDAALQLVRAEGPLAFYKGAGAHYAVSAPR
jgi:solute carrier family 25 protein 34/35